MHNNRPHTTTDDDDDDDDDGHGFTSGTVPIPFPPAGLGGLTEES